MASEASLALLPFSVPISFFLHFLFGSIVLRSFLAGRPFQLLSLYFLFLSLFFSLIPPSIDLGGRPSP